MRVPSPLRPRVHPCLGPSPCGSRVHSGPESTRARDRSCLGLVVVGRNERPRPAGTRARVAAMSVRATNERGGVRLRAGGGMKSEGTNFIGVDLVSVSDNARGRGVPGRRAPPGEAARGGAEAAGGGGRRPSEAAERPRPPGTRTRVADVSVRATNERGGARLRAGGGMKSEGTRFIRVDLVSVSDNARGRGPPRPEGPRRGRPGRGGGRRGRRPPGPAAADPRRPPNDSPAPRCRTSRRSPHSTGRP